MLYSAVLKLTAATLLATTAQAFDSTSNENVALYWGQNSEGTQERLSYYCESDAADILLLSFLYQFPASSGGVLGLNFASACSDEFSDGLLKCDDIASDIATCQSLGKKVLLSLGGASGSYGFSSDSDAETFATTLWNTFGEGDASERPFGTSVVDGFDFDIENNESTGYAALATELRSIFDSNGTKDYFLSAAPQCPYPDASVGDMLENAKIDFAFVQFYNNYCALDETFNWSTWADYAKNTSPNPDIKVFLGLPGSSSAAGSGYVDVDSVKSAVTDTIASDAENFGGIMLWDASQAWANVADDQNFAEAMKSILTEEFGSATATATAESSATSSTAAAATTTTSSSTTAAETTTSSTSTTDAETTTSSSSTTAVETTSTPVAETTPAPTETTSTTAETTPAAAQTTSSSSAETTPTTVATTAVQTTPATVLAATTSSTSTTAAVQPTTLTTVTSTPTTPTTTSTAATSTSTSATATATAAGYVDCSSKTGLEQAECMNENFANGLYLGSSSSCNEGEFACTSDGKLAQCNFGSWVTFQCAAGTTCYAYNSGDYVATGCNYSSEKSNYSS